MEGLIKMEKHSFIIMRDTLMEVEYKNTSSNIIIDEGIRTIGEMVFFNDDHVSSVICPKSLEVISKNAFADCHHLISVEFNDGLKEIGERAFTRTMLLGVEIPDTVTTLGKGAFVENKWLNSVTMSAPLYDKIKNEIYDYFPSTINSITIHHMHGTSREDKKEYEIISVRSI